MKTFADNKINVVKKLNFVLRRVENIVVKEENAGYQHFFLLPKCFQHAFFTGSLKVGILWEMVNLVENSWKRRKCWKQCPLSIVHFS